MIHDHAHRLLNQVARDRRITAMSTRHGYVHEVKEAGGERKARIVIGVRPDGSPMLSPWLNSEENRGGSRHQSLLEKGQNVVVQAHGGDYRNATITPSAEGKSFPQPAHAPKINGDTHQIGKLRVSYNRPKQQDSQEGGQQGSGGGGQGGSGGSGGSEQDGEHFYEVWLAEEDDNPP